MATILNVADAAAFLGVHPNSIRSYAKAGTIPAVKLGRGWRFIQDDLVAWMRERYRNHARMQPSADQEEAIWHSGTVQEHITS
ncbi:helix-turn-helix domain-containing protein, partial [Sphingomonas bacterium]|uniref:helix-turn-helix domain-containing protein n=1 Tax=Sphingomonas bacterium TaxID=1895847 RepID=UPI0015754A5E